MFYKNGKILIINFKHFHVYSVINQYSIFFFKPALCLW